MSLKSAEQMLPHEILAARDASGCAFVPVSPCFEWHSYHLPLGTDGLIAEGICRAMAETVGGIYFQPMSFGMDGYLNQRLLKASGFDESDKVFGMRFPQLPLFSEYRQAEEMTAAIGNRLEAIRQSGFRYAFLVNNHGGTGQKSTIESVAEQRNSDEFRVWSINTAQFCSCRHEQMEVGGHAGKCETLCVMAFRPELVDLSQLPDGELQVPEWGILHGQPVIEAQHNPRHVLLSVAQETRKSILEGFRHFIEDRCALDCSRPERPQR